MDIIFLDIDGVLNNTNTDRRKYNPINSEGVRLPSFVGVDPVHVDILNAVIEKTGAKIVLSSTWRTAFGKEGTLHTMKLSGFKYDIFDITPDADFDREVWPGRKFSEHDAPRGLEIAKWIERWDAKNPNDKVRNFVVLDDNSLRHPLDAKLVKTEWWPRDTEGGLREQHVPEILKHFGFPILPIGA